METAFEVSRYYNYYAIFTRTRANQTSLGEVWSQTPASKDSIYGPTYGNGSPLNFNVALDSDGRILAYSTFLGHNVIIVT